MKKLSIVAAALLALVLAYGSVLAEGCTKGKAASAPASAPACAK